MNSIPRLIASNRTRKRGFDQAARTAVETRQIQTVHGSHCICHRCRRV